jgi:hypothetical protein
MNGANTVPAVSATAPTPIPERHPTPHPKAARSRPRIGGSLSIEGATEGCGEGCGSGFGFGLGWPCPGDGWPGIGPVTGWPCPGGVGGDPAVVVLAAGPGHACPPDSGRNCPHVEHLCCPVMRRHIRDAQRRNAEGGRDCGSLAGDVGGGCGGGCGGAEGAGAGALVGGVGGAEFCPAANAYAWDTRIHCFSSPTVIPPKFVAPTSWSST